MTCPAKAALVNRAIQVTPRFPEDMTAVDACQAVRPLAALSLALSS